jgi:hypothetical protein
MVTFDLTSADERAEVRKLMEAEEAELKGPREAVQAPFHPESVLWREVECQRLLESKTGKVFLKPWIKALCADGPYRVPSGHIGERIMWTTEQIATAINAHHEGKGKMFHAMTADAVASYIRIIGSYAKRHSIPLSDLLYVNKDGEKPTYAPHESLFQIYGSQTSSREWRKA